MLAFCFFGFILCGVASRLGGLYGLACVFVWWITVRVFSLDIYGVRFGCTFFVGLF